MTEIGSEQPNRLKEQVIRQPEHHQANPSRGNKTGTGRFRIGEAKIGKYKGSTEYLGRGIKAYEDEWNTDRNERISYNGLISEAIERAVKDKRNEVVIFDFGCGDGNAIRDFLANNNSSTMKLLSDHPEISVKFIGLTDTPRLSESPTQEELTSGRQLKSDDEEPTNVSARIDYYAVTAARTLEEYFVTHNIDSIDVAMAVQSLSYIPLKNFDSTLQSIISRLKVPESTFIAASYAKQVPGFRPNIIGIPNIDVRTQTYDASIPSTIRDRGARFDFPATDTEVEIQNLNSAFNMYKNLGVLTQQEIEEAIDNELPSRERLVNRARRRTPNIGQFYRTKDSRQHLSNVASLLLTRADNRLGSMRLEEIQEKRKIYLAACNQNMRNLLI